MKINTKYCTKILYSLLWGSRKWTANGQSDQGQRQKALTLLSSEMKALKPDGR